MASLSCPDNPRKHGGIVRLCHVEPLWRSRRSEKSSTGTPISRAKTPSLARTPTSGFDKRNAHPSVHSRSTDYKVVPPELRLPGAKPEPPALRRCGRKLRLDYRAIIDPAPEGFAATDQAHAIGRAGLGMMPAEFLQYRIERRHTAQTNPRHVGVSVREKSQNRALQPITVIPAISANEL